MDDSERGPFLNCTRALAFVAASCLAIGASTMVAFSAVGALHRRGENPPHDPNEIIREAIANELREQENDDSYWRYMQSDQQHGQTITREILETQKGDIHRNLSIDGHQLTQRQAAQETARLSRLVYDNAELSKKAAEKQKDIESERKVLKMLPDAFRYTFIAQDGDLVRLAFAPNPSFQPTDRTGKVFHHMAGSIWVDSKQDRVARFQGRLTSNVTFGGFLGHLRAGGTFDVEQKDVGGGCWELVRLDVNMDGRVLFFKGINVHQSVRDFSFTRIPAGITPQQAIQLLAEPAVAAFLGRQSSTVDQMHPCGSPP